MAKDTSVNNDFSNSMDIEDLSLAEVEIVSGGSVTTVVAFIVIVGVAAVVIA